MSKATAVLVRIIINAGYFCAVVALTAPSTEAGVWIAGIIAVAMASCFSYDDGRRDGR